MVNWQYWLLDGTPPPSWLQDFNDLIHKEPYATLSWGVFWLFFFFATPFCGVFVMIWAALLLVRHFLPIEKMMSTNDKELGVVITGCDTGFGYDLAVELGSKEEYSGYHVFACCLSKESLSKFQELSNVTPIVVDVCSDKDVANLSKQVLGWVNETKGEKQRYLHAVVNNAGIGTRGGLVDFHSIEDYKKHMDVNLFGQIRLVLAFLPQLKDQFGIHQYAHARIINTTSLSGKCASMGMSVYATSKYAAEGFTGALRLELRDFGVHVVTMSPSFHLTDLCVDMDDRVANYYKEELPKELVQRYGEDYFEKNLRSLMKAPQSIMWRRSNVTEAFLDAISSIHPQHRYLVGMDAKFALMVNSMLPEALHNIMTPRLLHPPAFFAKKVDGDTNSTKEKLT